MINQTQEKIGDGIEKTVAVAEKTAQSPTVQMLGRFGYFTRGILYFLIGTLAVLVALGGDGKLTDQKSVIDTIAAAPFGKFLLIAILIGSVGFGLWSILRGVADLENKGSDTKGLITRASYVGIGIVYFLLALTIWSVTGTSKSADTGNSSFSVSQMVLSLPFGSWLLILGGLSVVGVGIFQFYKAYKKLFAENLELGRMDETRRKAIINFGRFGFVARGIIFAIIGYFILAAAWNYNPREAKDFSDALGVIASQSYGKILLFITALGLVCFGIFSMMQAKYRKFETSAQAV